MGKIITPTSSAPAAELPKMLDFKQVNQLAGALARLHEIKSYAVQTKAHEAELTGLVEFLSTELFNHAPEFLGCWFTIKQEYEPALRLVAMFSHRVGAILKRSEAASVAVEEADPAPVPESEPANVIKLDTATQSPS